MLVLLLCPCLFQTVTSTKAEAMSTSSLTLFYPGPGQVPGTDKKLTKQTLNKERFCTHIHRKTKQWVGSGCSWAWHTQAVVQILKAHATEGTTEVFWGPPHPSTHPAIHPQVSQAPKLATGLHALPTFSPIISPLDLFCFAFCFFCLEEAPSLKDVLGPPTHPVNGSPTWLVLALPRYPEQMRLRKFPSIEDYLKATK